MTKTGSARDVCVVTGGARGIGRAIVDAFLAAGASVHSIDVAHPEGASGPSLLQHTLDIRDLGAVEQTARSIGKVDVLVNNAATVTRVVPITDLEPEEWEHALSVNITGAFNVTRAFLPSMGKGGRIVNLASTFGHVGSPGRVAYATTKGAMLAFSRSLALDCAPLGIRVNSVSPGGIATDRLVEQFGSHGAADAHLAPLHPIGRIGVPADIAAAVVFLASAGASFMTGADLLVDGGYTAR